MRLTEKEVLQIITAIDVFMQETGKGTLQLYGSRVEDHFKGGDIDLVLILENQKELKALKEKHHQIVAQIKKQIGDRKIDFSIVDSVKSKTDAFWIAALKKSVLLKKY